MAGVRFADQQSRPTEFLDVTSLTLDELQALVPPFEAAFQTHMAELCCALHNVSVRITPWQPMI
jgi:hypothetical protein